MQSDHKFRRGLVITGGVLFVLGMLLIALLHLDLPKIRSLADYSPPESTKIYSDDGELVAVLAQERRTVVPYARIPQHVIQAFLAAEDANFFEHEGIDYLGILRAALKNLRPWGNRQGASTITQQTVKTLVLGRERSYIRKFKEAILAHELEQLLSKEEILAIYLNQIYFGSGAFGIEEAAQTYFNKSVDALTLSEAALLAAIPKNPSRYNIKSDPAAAKLRQIYVLHKIREHGWADTHAIAQAIEAPLPKPFGLPPYMGCGPHYMDIVRQKLIDTYGEAKVYTGGLQVYINMHAKMQTAAHLSLRQSIEDVARRQGYGPASLRIPEKNLEALLQSLHLAYTEQQKKLSLYEMSASRKNMILWDLSSLNASHIADANRISTSVVNIVPRAAYQRLRAPVIYFNKQRHEALLDLGGATGRLALKNMLWAHPYSARVNRAAPSPKDPSAILHVGDVIQVEIMKGFNPQDTVIDVALVPEPRLEGAVVAIEPSSHAVRALVGSYSLDAGGFNRATQALRQPGSAFKPIVYAAALANYAITPASVCPDSPVVIADPWTGKLWKPENYEDGRYDGSITYRQALTHSKNTCSVRLVQKIGPQAVIDMAKNLGINSKMPNNFTIALGTGDLTVMELTNAYATIAAGGAFAKPIFIRKVIDKEGHVLEDNKPNVSQALTPEVAYILTSMMRSVISEGTGRRAAVLGLDLAGKTGTSQESRNLWFAGFSEDLAAAVWVGFDNNDSLGRETGASAALPGWIRFMGMAHAAIPPHDFPVPENIVHVWVDPNTGRPLDGNAMLGTGLQEVFIKGTEPNLDTSILPNVFMQDND